MIKFVTNMLPQHHAVSTNTLLAMSSLPVNCHVDNLRHFFMNVIELFMMFLN
jgi:hypothetical protein